MAWFKYLKSNETINSNTVNENYSYPYCKRTIGKFTPKDTIQQDTWVFASIENININKYKNSSLQDTDDETSYIVVYEKSDTFYPVPTVINENYIYFQTYEQHTAGSEINGQYAIYYNTPNLRKLDTINNGGKTDYQINLIDNTDFYADVLDLNTELYSVNLNSDSTYNFSFINSITNWNNGLSNKSGSRLYINFTGPKFILYGSKGPDYGKFKIKFTVLSKDINVPNYLGLDWQTIDLFSSSYKEDQILFNKIDFEEKDYVVELEVLNSKNINSTGKNIKISSYSFSYNLYLEIGKEQINQNDNVFSLISGVR